jgi:hypothetical protein|tara:strand:- start:1149 stop:1409 length:261 start_codon:yes stop_codon:yes gene_type:complete
MRVLRGIVDGVTRFLRGILCGVTRLVSEVWYTIKRIGVVGTAILILPFSITIYFMGAFWEIVKHPFVSGQRKAQQYIYQYSKFKRE